MASSPYSGVLEYSLSTAQTARELGPVIRRNLEIAQHTTSSMVVVKASSSPAPSPPPSPHPMPSRLDMLTDLGDYLSRTAIMLSVFTENVIQGPHIDRLNRDMHRRANAESTLSDLKAIAAEDVNFTRLRKIRDLTAQFSRDVQAVWHPELVSPESVGTSQALMSPTCDVKPMPPPRSLSLSGSEADMKPFKSRKLLHHDSSDHADEGSIKTAESGSDDSDDDDEQDDEQFKQIDMNALRQRGKGVYYCPKGSRCDKGGVDKEGNLVRFDRNSSFIQHCNKHRKPWRCELQGCPNPPKKRRFARRDGLERHKATVKHYVVT